MEKTISELADIRIQMAFLRGKIVERRAVLDVINEAVKQKVNKKELLNALMTLLEEEMKKSQIDYMRIASLRNNND